MEIIARIVGAVTTYQSPCLPTTTVTKHLTPPCFNVHSSYVLLSSEHSCRDSLEHTSSQTEKMTSGIAGIRECLRCYMDDFPESVSVDMDNRFVIAMAFHHG